MLSDQQFVENRVYDEHSDDEDDEGEGGEEVGKEAGLDAEADQQPKMDRATVEKTAVEEGMKALEMAFLEPVEGGDNGDSGDCCYFYDAVEADLFNSRALPFVVGSEE